MRPSRSARANLLRAVAAVVALVLTAVTARAQALYFYCPAMDSVASRPCCDAPHAPTDEPAVDLPDCCRAMHVASLPNGATPPAPDVAAPRWVAVVPALAEVARPTTHEPGPAGLDAHRRGPPLPRDARARTMVFLI